MKIKLTISQLKEILKYAEHNEKGGNNASCIILIDSKIGNEKRINRVCWV